MVMQCPCFQVVEVSVAYYLFKLRAAYGSFVKLQLHCLIFFLLFLIISLLYILFVSGYLSLLSRLVLTIVAFYSI